MKKLMLAAAIVCAAVASQAAVINWKTNNQHLTDADNTALTSMPAGLSLALVVMDSATGWDTAKDITSLTTISINSNSSASLKGRVTGAVSFTYNGDGAQGTDISNNQYLALMFKDDEGLHQLSYVAGGDVDAVWQVTGLLNNSTTIASTVANIGMTGNFYAESVPEPTSGLLLLLGMAGLALRRRCA